MNVPALSAMGQPAPRVDGVLKVTGQARYPSDAPLEDPVYAALATSAIARGAIKRIDLEAAKAVAGVLDVLWFETVGDAVKPVEFFGRGGPMGSSIRPLASPRVAYDGEIVALVLAETYEAAREAAYKVVVDYEPDAPSAGFDAPGAVTVAASDALSHHADPSVGDAEEALRAAPVGLEARYATATMHHNPIELFTTSCVWSGDQLTIHEPSQFVYGLKSAVARQLGLDADKVRVVSPFVGGGFGAKGMVTQRTALVALAARRLNRPVKLVATRAQGFTIATYRAETAHRVRLGASKDGKLLAYAHEGFEVTSRDDPFFVAGGADTCRMYDFGAVSTKTSIVRADRNTPGFMRSPPVTPYMFALESAIDEMAAKLGLDPVEFRRRNEPKADPISGKPFSSRSLTQCYEAAAQAFGWRDRDPRPGSMHDGDWLVGWGCASAVYPTHVGAATARVRLSPGGKASVETAAHDLGTGAYTVVAQLAAERLGLALADVTVALGDSSLPPAPVAGGSNTTASVSSVVLKACEAIRERLFRAAATANEGPLAGEAAAGLSLVDGAVSGPRGAREALADVFKRLGVGMIEEYAEFTPPGAPADAIARLYRGAPTLVGGASGAKLMFAFGAEFVEARVHVRTREIRVPRLVGAFAAGRIANPRTARSQLMGGMIWGVSHALHEKTEIDEATARYVNRDLAGYLIPVNADIHQVDVILIPEIDHDVNPAGVKGLGELGNVGTAAAIASAVHHATGIRVRHTPIRIEDLLPAA